MQVRKMNGKVIGAELTTNEKKALDMEIRREFIEYDKQNTTEVDAIVLYLVRKHFGADDAKLREFFDDFGREMEALISRYELEDRDQVWLCTLLLKDQGIDIDAWRRENGWK
jgi:hypothetical protein